ncbi:MAG: alpha/beta hydrolase [Planctomycetaceae bacterium]|jgi:acetyl esterase/lipase|nr:alpha/beta hydrolase [Planctomycetaceae bacterium]
MRDQFILLFFVYFCVSVTFGAELPERSETKNISYYAETNSEYQKTQCVLDISTLKDGQKLPVLVWFHGGGLTEGSKEIPKHLQNTNIVLVGVGYRLAPKAKFPEFLEDVAAALAWTFANIEHYGGNPKQIYVGGCSAGAYLAAMIGLDSRWLKPYHIEPSQLAGLVLLTGQMTTHFHVRKMLNYPQPEYFPIIDENAPLHYISKDAPPILLVLGDRERDWPVRVQENEFMAASLRAMKHPHVEFYEIKGYDHGGIAVALEAFQRIAKFISEVKPSILKIEK